MKRFFLFLLACLLISGVYIYQSHLLKQKVIRSLQADTVKITAYSHWGYNTRNFEKIYTDLLSESNSISFIIFPFRTEYIKNKHDNILRLTQAGYATEIAKQKGLIQLRLAYLRDRIKMNPSISLEKKQIFSDSLEVIAGGVFEKNSDLNAFGKAFQTLEEQDLKITKEIENTRKETLLSELRGYRNTCNELLTYFTGKNSTAGQVLAEECISEADKLMGPGYTESGADFIETLSRERVFTLLQKSLLSKQQIEQEEAFALAEKKREEERLTIVPSAPRQDGKVIVVNLALQRLYAYENGTTIFSTAVPITTGKYGFETVTGEFAIYLKELNHKMVSPFPGIYYDDVVNYWMPFYLGYGLHDAPWRSVYGTQDYPSVGSHGCINIPYKETSILYNWAEVGTKVIVL
jgi:hypothetical protein